MKGDCIKTDSKYGALVFNGINLLIPGLFSKELEALKQPCNTEFVIEISLSMLFTSIVPYGFTFQRG
jgi:hypothetical protein